MDGWSVFKVFGGPSLLDEVEERRTRLEDCGTEDNILARYVFRRRFRHIEVVELQSLGRHVGAVLNCLPALRSVSIQDGDFMRERRFVDEKYSIPSWRSRPSVT